MIVPRSSQAWHGATTCHDGTCSMSRLHQTKWETGLLTAVAIVVRTATGWGRHDVGSTHSKSGHCRARCAHPRPICIPPIRNGERRRERRGGNGELTISLDGTVRSGSGLGARLRCLARSHRPPGWRSRAPPPAPPKASSHGQRVGGGGSSTRTVARVPDARRSRSVSYVSPMVSPFATFLFSDAQAVSLAGLRPPPRFRWPARRPWSS